MFRHRWNTGAVYGEKANPAAIDTDERHCYQLTLRSTHLEKRNEIPIIVLQLHPSIDERRHQDIQISRLTQSRSDRVRQCAKSIIKDKQILLLIFLESKCEIA